MRDQARAATDQLQAAAQDCQTDARRFYSAKNDVEGDMAKKLPEALVGVKRKLEEAEAEILRKENDADSTRVRLLCVLCVCTYIFYFFVMTLDYGLKTRRLDYTVDVIQAGEAF